MCQNIVYCDILPFSKTFSLSAPEAFSLSAPEVWTCRYCYALGPGHYVFSCKNYSMGFTIAGNKEH